MSGSETVVAYFKSPSEAERALSNLRDAGFTREQTGFANSSLLHNRGNQSSLDETGDQRNFTTSDQDSHSEGIWDRIVHFFEGDSTQGSGIGDTNDNIGNNNDDYDNDVYGHDEWSGSLGSMGLSGERSRYFEQQLNNGREGALITVQAGDRRQEAEQILRSSGGDLGENAANFQTQERSENWEQDRGSASQSERQRVQLLGEVLRVHKERVSKGEVRLRKEVVTENQNIQVPVSREELIIERRPGSDRAASGQTIGKESDIRIPISEERVQVEKRPVVREEVEISKRRVEETKEVGDEVRHEELRVDKDENINVEDRSRSKKRRIA